MQVNPSLSVLTIVLSSLVSVLSSQYLPRPPAPLPPSPLDSRFMLYKDLSGPTHPQVQSQEHLNRQPQLYTPFPATYLIDPHLQTQPTVQEVDDKTDPDYDAGQKEVRDQQLLSSAAVSPPRVVPTVGPQPRAGSPETRALKHSRTRDSTTDPQPEPPSVFDREYARVELDSNKEIKRQEEDEGKKDEFDEDDTDDWESDEWDDFDDGPLAERERKTQENEEWKLIRGRDHVRTKGVKRPTGRRKRRKKKRPVKSKKQLLNDLYYDQRIKGRKKKAKRVKGRSKSMETDPDEDYVQVPRHKSSSQRHKRRRVPDPVTDSYHESLYRKDRKKRMPKGRTDRRLRSKGSDRRKRRQRKQQPIHEAVEEFEDDGRSADRMEPPIARSSKKRRRHKPKRYSKNYVYIKKKPRSKDQEDGVTDDYDVAYARGNYQAFVDEYDSDEDPHRPQTEESVAYLTTWRE